MRGDELRDAGAMAGTTAGEITDLARDVHRAVAGRLFKLAGKPAEPIRLMHDGIATIAYTGTKLGVRYLPPAAGYVARAFADPAAESAHDSATGRSVLGAINGILGDRMADEASALTATMRARLHGGRLRHDPANLAADAADPHRSGDTTEPTGRIVVFVHGLCETDLAWSFSAEKRWGDRTATYGSRLRDDDGWTPVYLNFNTGLHISENGLLLAQYLDELTDHWPKPVTEIALVGHSLGGLVARGATHQGHAAGHEWITHLRHVVGLGTPQLGAPMERWANWGMHHLGRLPETRPFAKFFNQRSVGIKDLRYGAMLEEDWLGFDPDELLNDRVTAAQLLPGVAYSVASATLTREPRGVFATDLLVQHSSAHGIGKVRSIPFEPDRTFHLGGGKHHFDLLADERVYERLRQWLRGADGAASAPNDPPAARVAKRQMR